MPTVPTLAASAAASTLKLVALVPVAFKRDIWNHDRLRFPFTLGWPALEESGLLAGRDFAEPREGPAWHDMACRKLAAKLVTSRCSPWTLGLLGAGLSAEGGF